MIVSLMSPCPLLADVAAVVVAVVAAVMVEAVAVCVVVRMGLNKQNLVPKQTMKQQTQQTQIDGSGEEE